MGSSSRSTSLRPDTISAATMASLLNAAALYKKVSGTAQEKQAIDNTTINSNGGVLDVRFASSDSQFSSLLAVESVPVGSAVVYLGLVRLGAQVTAPFGATLTTSDP